MSALGSYLGNAAGYAHVIADLFEGSGMTVRELSERSGLAHNTVRKVVAILRRRGSVLRVSEWRRDSIGRQVIPAFELSAERDAPKPPPLHYKERQKRWRERNRTARLEMRQ